MAVAQPIGVVSGHFVDVDTSSLVPDDASVQPGTEAKRAKRCDMDDHVHDKPHDTRHT